MNEYVDKSCEHQAEVVSYLYGELDESQSANFQRHLRECVDCESELASFGTIRGAIATWKQESVLGTLPAASIVSVPTPRKSALVAFRGFFSLAPLWTKAAVALAVVTFFVLVGLAAANLSSASRSQETNVREPDKKYSQRDLDAAVAAAVRKNEVARSSANVLPQNIVADTGTTSKKTTTNTAKIKSEVGGRRPLTRAERQELAADLRLTSSKDDNDDDLIGERINNY